MILKPLWEQAGSEMINEATQVFAFAPESESELINSVEFHKATRVLKVRQKKKKKKPRRL